MGTYTGSAVFSGKKIHTNPNIYIAVEMNRTISSNGTDTLNVNVHDLFVEDTANMSYFNHIYKVRFRAVAGGNTFTKGLVSLSRGEIDDKLGGGVYGLTNKLLNTTFSFNLNSSKSTCNMYIDIQCSATLESSSGDGCHILGDEHGHSSLKWFTISGGKSISGYTPPSGLTARTKLTGTTITANLTWTGGSIASASYIRIDGGSYIKVAKETDKVFKELKPNTTHTIDYYITDGVTKLSGSKTLITLYSELISVNSSTSAIRFIANGTTGYNINVSVCEYGSINDIYVNQVSSGTEITICDLKHNTTYIVYACEIGVDGNNILDTRKSIQINTKKFEVEGEVTPHQFSIEGRCQAKANGEIYNIDNITNVLISYDITYESNYDGNIGMTGDIKTKSTTFELTNLTSYTPFDITIVASDGYNTCSTKLSTRTLYPYVRLCVNGEWHKAMVYIHTGENWSLCKTNIHNGSNFVETSAE